MICISIAQQSRRLALADMVNASPQCDLLEVRLDRFAKAPEVAELLANKPKPVIMSCRRRQDGGDWQGSEEERLALLRQCIVGKADYVEIELDAADQIRKFPPAKRVITYTNVSETPRDIARIYAECQKKSPDVVKLTTLARTAEEAWPLVQILAKPALPTLVTGLGRPGLMLTVLGKKIGAPWTYAALEKGMEAYPGQPTVHELNTVYHYRSIDRSTRLIGVTGFTELEFATVAGLNAALARLGLPARCLPIQMGSLASFRKVMDAVRLASVVVDDHYRGPVLEVVPHPEGAAKESEAADVLVQKDGQWHGYNTLWRAGVAALEAALRARTPADKPLQGRIAVILGTNATARSMAYGVKRRGGVPIVASRDGPAAQRVAQLFGCRHILYEALYSTMHDVLIVASDEKDKLKEKARSGESGVHSGYLKPSMSVMDLTTGPRASQLLRDADLCGCVVVSPRQVLLLQLELQVQLITGQEVPRELLEETLNGVLGAADASASSSLKK